MTLDNYASPDGEALLRAGADGTRPIDRRRELISNVVPAAGFLIAAGTLAAVAPWRSSLRVWHLALALVAYIIVERVRFPAAAGWGYPTMLAFVPMLFVLPTPVVPVTAMAAILLGALPGYARRRKSLSRLPADIADAWFSFGPALVIVLAGAQHFAWSHWPVYAGALVAEMLFDMASTVGRCWSGEGIKPKVMLPRLSWVYAVDAGLAPVGLIIAASAVSHPGVMLLTLPIAALFALFARERQQRLDAVLELSTAYRGTTLLLGDIVEADDRYTGVHSRDVVDLSVAIAESLGLDATGRRNVEFGALLHDVGKIRVPKEILNKPGALDPAEWETVRTHTIEGERMLRQVGGTIANLGPIVRASHERWDGCGYPDGLRDEQIPIEARIISACDAYSAMTTDRPYRRALDPGEALAELHRGAGSQFDPRVVEALAHRVRTDLWEVSAQSFLAHSGEAVTPVPEPVFAAAAKPPAPRRQGYTAVSARL